MTERLIDFIRGSEMEKMFEKGLWLERKTEIFGTVVAKTGTMELVELE